MLFRGQQTVNRYKYLIIGHRDLPIMWNVLVSWSTWSDVCDFVQKPVFKVGTYLDKDDKPTASADTDRMGVLLNGSKGDVLVKQGEYLYYAFGKYFIHTDNGYEPI